MYQICRWLSWCRASNPRSMFVRRLHGCTTIGTSQMMGLSFWGLISIFHQKLFLPHWRNLRGPLVGQWVARLVTGPGNLNFDAWFFMVIWLFHPLDGWTVINRRCSFEPLEGHHALMETAQDLVIVMGTEEALEEVILVVKREVFQQISSHHLE